MTAGASPRIKYACLFFLSFQTATHVVLTRYSRSTNRDNPYIASTVVTLVEIFRLINSLFIHFLEKGCSISGFISSLYNEVFRKPVETFKLIAPASLYVIQNSLLFVALSNLDSTTYQVCYQLKILTTALFSVFMLRKRLRLSQWISLIILTAGVALVQLVKADNTKSSASTGSAFVGLLTVLAASLLSGFNGVYFEKVLKGSNQSLWIRNIQLGGFSVVVALSSICINDGDAISSKGFFQGYNFTTWAVITVGVLGGLTTSLVVKYADNILKGFAASISIIISAFVSFYLFNDFEPAVGFFVGAFLVIFATLMYGVDFNKKKEHTIGLKALSPKSANIFSKQTNILV